MLQKHSFSLRSIIIIYFYISILILIIIIINQTIDWKREFSPSGIDIHVEPISSDHEPSKHSVMQDLF